MPQRAPPPRSQRRQGPTIPPPQQPRPQPERTRVRSEAVRENDREPAAAADGAGKAASDDGSRPRREPPRPHPRHQKQQNQRVPKQQQQQQQQQQQLHKKSQNSHHKSSIPMTPQSNPATPARIHPQQQQQQHQHQQQQRHIHQCQQHIDTGKHSYEWDPNNAQRFFDARAAMLEAIFSTASANDHDGPVDANENKNEGANLPANFRRSQSDQLPFTSPTRPADIKQYNRASSADALSSNPLHGHAAPPPSLPNLGSSERSLTASQRRWGGNKVDLRNSARSSPLADGNSGRNVAMANATMEALDAVLPAQRNYTSCALRFLLMDTPLPLAGTGGVEVRARPPLSDESVFLLPRYWLSKWANWARNKIVVLSVECWFAHWARFDAQFQNGNVDNGGPGRPTNGQHSRRTYSFLPELLKALAALSILADQYQLHADTEQDWVEWMRGLEIVWNRWHELQGRSNRGGHKHRTATEEKKQDEAEATSEIPPYPQFSFPFFPPPGPVDGRILSRRDRPLMMHPRISLSARGLPDGTSAGTGASRDAADDDERDDVLSQAEEADETLLCEFVDSLAVPDGPHAASPRASTKLAVCPVPVKFYELCRSTHGVRCDDGDLSFAPPVGATTANGGGSRHDGAGGVRGSDDGGDGAPGGENGATNPPSIGNLENGTAGNPASGRACSLLFHDQWEVDGDGRPLPPRRNEGRVDRGGYHPCYFENGLAPVADADGGPAASPRPAFETRPFRPIEFRRRILAVPKSRREDPLAELGGGGGGGKKEKVATPYSKLMQEAMLSRSERVKSKKAGAGGKGREIRNSGGKNSLPEGSTWGGNSAADASGGGIADGALAEEGDVGYVVEVFPVEFRYVVADGARCSMPPAGADDAANDGVANDTNDDGTDDKNVNNADDTSADTANRTPNDNGTTHAAAAAATAADRRPPRARRGVALASRASPAIRVLRDLERAAAPDRASACARLWRRSPSDRARRIGAGRPATASGDGYDLLDVDALAPPPGPTGAEGGSKRDPASLTVEEWLGLEKLSPGGDDSRSGVPAAVELLIETRAGPSSGWAREPLELGNRLRVGDFVDAQDSARKWYEAVVREVTPETVKVHYFGWGSRWDAELPRRKGTGSKMNPPEPLWTRTSRWRERIAPGDEVEVRESTSMVQRPKWHRATVLAAGRETDPRRELEGGAELETHGEDGRGRRKPVMLLERGRQVLVEVPQEIHNCSGATPLTPPPALTTASTLDSVEANIPPAQPPFRRWVDLYGEEICRVNTHKTAKKHTNSPATLNYTMESKRQPVEVMKPYNNIHGSGFVRESLRGIPPAAGTVGLHNLGNTCYMNSILQCINHIKPITRYFLKGEYVKEVNKNNPLGSGGRIVTAYASFLSDVWTGEYSILAPRLLKQTVSCFAPQFNNNYQHDSQEFCQYLMDGLHEDLNRVRDKPYVEHAEVPHGMDDATAAMESWRRHLLRHDSIFVDHTQGMHRSHLTCPSCGKESIKFDVYSSISLPLVPAKNRPSIPLKDCLDQFAAGEQLDEHNAWYCSTCKKHVCALKLITLWNTPDVLVLHLKRFTFEKCPAIDGRLIRKKIEERVDFPIDRLDLSPYVLGPADPEAPPIYRLFGVSEHMGTTANSGHYTATVRNSEDGNWYRHNDSAVGTTSGDAAVTGGAYLLFYQRSKGSSRWAGMERQMMLEEEERRRRRNGGRGGGDGAAGEDADGFREVTGKKNRKKKLPS